MEEYRRGKWVYCSGNIAAEGEEEGKLANSTEGKVSDGANERKLTNSEEEGGDGEL